MSQFNIQNNQSIEDNYQAGLLPQRNHKNYWYSDSSCRSNLQNFNLSSENRRILKKTQDFSYKLISAKDFKYDIQTQKNISDWVKQLSWDFPTNSIKNIFTDHIFNYVYLWKDQNDRIIAYSICYFSDFISHIGYVFYHPKFDHGNLPIRLVLQTIIDSHSQKLKYCYLGRFSPETGYYKRNMPSFEYFKDNQWLNF